MASSNLSSFIRRSVSEDVLTAQGLALNTYLTLNKIEREYLQPFIFILNVYKAPLK